MNKRFILKYNMQQKNYTNKNYNIFTRTLQLYELSIIILAFSSYFPHQHTMSYFSRGSLIVVKFFAAFFFMKSSRVSRWRSRRNLVFLTYWWLHAGRCSRLIPVFSDRTWRHVPTPSRRRWSVRQLSSSILSWWAGVAWG